MTRGPRTLRSALGCILLAALYTCSQDPAGPAGTPMVDPGGAEDAVVRLPADDARPVVVAFGDSLTSGHGVGPGSTYPAFLQHELDRRGLQFRVVNEGVSGDTTARALSRVDVALSHRPRWVILAIGANDGLRGLPLDAMERNVDSMVRRFTDGGAKVLLAGMMLPRNYGPEYVRDFEAVYPRVAGSANLPLIPFLLEGVAMRRELNNRDGIHPNAEGNRIIARHVADALEPLVAP